MPGEKGSLGRAEWEHDAARCDPSGLIQSLSHDGNRKERNETGRRQWTWNGIALHMGASSPHQAPRGSLPGLSRAAVTSVRWESMGMEPALQGDLPCRRSRSSIRVTPRPKPILHHENGPESRFLRDCLS